MTIECFGLPGAGKTHVVEHLLLRGGVSTIPAYSSRVASIFFISRHPFFSVRVLVTIIRECMKINAWGLFRFKTSVFLNTIGRLWYMRQRKPSAEMVIIDEGLLQRLLSLYETKQDTRVFERWISHMPRCDTIVIVSRAGVGRDAVRVGTSRRGMGSEYEERWREVMIHNHTNILEALVRLRIAACHFRRGGVEVDSIEELSGCLKTA